MKKQFDIYKPYLIIVQMVKLPGYGFWFPTKRIYPFPPRIINLKQ